MGARDENCTRGEACGANMDCNNFPGGYNCTCSSGFVIDPRDNSSCVCKYLVSYLAALTSQML